MSTVRQRALEDRALHAVDALLDVVRRRCSATASSTSLGMRLRSSSTALTTPLAGGSTMLASCAFRMSSVIDGTAVDAGDRRLLLLAVDDVGDLREVDGAAALLRDDDAAELRGILDLAFDAHDAVALAARQAAGGHVLVRDADRAHHLVEADAERGERIRLDLHEDLPRDLAEGVDARDARDVLEPLDDRVVGERGELAQVGAVGHDGERDHRVLVLRRRRAPPADPWRRAGTTGARWPPCRARPASRATCRCRGGTRRTPSSCPRR